VIVRTNLDKISASNLMEKINEPAYIVEGGTKLLFMSKAYFNIIGMPNCSLKEGESLRDILAISRDLGSIEQACMDNMLKASEVDVCDIGLKVRLLLSENVHTGHDQTTGLIKGEYTIKRSLLPNGLRLYRYELCKNNLQMMQILQRVMHISKTGFYKYDHIKKSYFYCKNLLDWFSNKEQQIIQTGGIFSLMLVENRRRLEANIRNMLLRNQTAIEFTEQIDLRKVGSSIFKFSLETSYNTMGQPVCTLAVVNDITSQRVIEKKLKKQKLKADEAAQFRAHQIAHMSHEIRTPLSGIVGMSDVLLAEKFNEETIEKIKIIKQSSELMMHTLTETLDHCKLMADGVNLKPVTVALETLLESTCLLWRGKASRNGVAISFRLCPDLPPLIYIDENRIRQCLNNLLSNAVKFTTSGKIEIFMKKQVNNKGKTQLVVLVKDSGIGMTPEQQNKLFKPFSQADDTIAVRFGGSGLGMCITQKIIESMKGYMVVRSTKGIGTTVALIFPLVSGVNSTSALSKNMAQNITNINSAAVIKETKPRQENILIVDDIKTNQIVIECILCDSFPNLTFANNGKEAIDILNKQSIDLILMDIHMPILNGIDTTKAIRSSGAGYRDVPIVAVTADEECHKRVFCEVVGFNDVITKPVNQVTLLDIIDKTLRKPRTRIGNIKQLFA
jgi:signal transduction histidine kinase